MDGAQLCFIFFYINPVEDYDESAMMPLTCSEVMNDMETIIIFGKPTAGILL